MVSSCEGFQLESDYKPRALRQGKIEPMSPWDVVSIDIMGPFISGRKGERYILSVIDCFSQYLILIPMLLIPVVVCIYVYIYPDGSICICLEFCLNLMVVEMSADPQIYKSY